MKNRCFLLTIIFVLLLASCQAKIEKKVINQKLDFPVNSLDLEIFKALQQVAQSLPFESMTLESQIIETGKLFYKRHMLEVL